LPGSLVVVLLGVLAVPLLDLADRGVATVGPIQAGLPTLGMPGASNPITVAGALGGVEPFAASGDLTKRPGGTVQKDQPALTRVSAGQSRFVGRADRI
jgi:hypothetical protein